MERERILITVRTYPTISKQYLETVCTAGVTQSQEWRRLYPVSLRYLEDEQQYRVWDVVDVTVGPAQGDNRPESRRPNSNTLEIIQHVKRSQTKVDWVMPTVFQSLGEMESKQRSIGGVEVSEVLEYQFRDAAPEWSAAQLDTLKQQDLWAERKPLEKIPYDFHVRWRDGDGVEHRSLIIEWEFIQTWRKFRRLYENGLQTTVDKWYEETDTSRRKVVFFLGNHSRWRDNFMLCGTMRVPKGEASIESLFG